MRRTLQSEREHEMKGNRRGTDPQIHRCIMYRTALLSAELLIIISVPHCISLCTLELRFFLIG